MTNRVLEIIFRLKDEVTKNFNHMVKKFASDLKSLGRSLNEIGTFALRAGAVITGPMALAFNAAARHSRAVSDELEKVKTVTSAFQLSVATAMIPVVQTLTNILGRLYTAWQNLGEEKQRVIVKTVLMTGIFLTFGGTLLKLAGNIVKTAGVILSLGRGLDPIHRNIMLITAAIGLMIITWKQIRPVVEPIINFLELGVSTIALGFLELIRIIADAIVALLDKLPRLLDFMAKIGSPLAIAIKALNKDQEDIAAEFRSIADNAEFAAQKVLENMGRIAVGGSGITADFLNNISKEYEELKAFINSSGTFDFKAWKDQLRALERQIRTMHDVFIDTSTQAAQAMARSLGDFFFNPFAENVRSAKEMFADFGRSIARIMADVAAKWAITMTLGRMFGPFNLLGLKFHSGGTVPRAHDGAFVNAAPSREFPILVRGGETIRTEAQEASLQRKFRGQNITIQPVVVIQAWDTQDVMRNKNMIIDVVQDAVTRNASIRETFRRYT